MKKILSLYLSLVFFLSQVLLANTAEANSVLIERDWIINSGQTSVKFPAGTVVTKGDGGRFAFYEMAAQQITIEDTTATGLDGDREHILL